MYVLYACTKTEPQKLPEHTSEHVKAQNFQGACPQTPSHNLCYGPRILYLPWAPPILSAALPPAICLKYSCRKKLSHFNVQEQGDYYKKQLYLYLLTVMILSRLLVCMQLELLKSLSDMHFNHVLRKFAAECCPLIIFISLMRWILDVISSSCCSTSSVHSTRISPVICSR